MPSESEIIERLREITKLPEGSRVTLGIGDDCAIYRPLGSGEDLLFTVDLFIEDVHFRRETHEAGQIARNALARSLSDIAAMGGVPRFCLVSLCVPAWASSQWVADFFDSLAAFAASAEAAVAGGDLSRGEKCVCDVTVCGAVPRGKALRRDGAKALDQLYVSGALGGSARGLQTHKGRAWQRHLSPEPRLGLGVFLRDHLRATASIDISDGLSLDLRRLCLASGLAADISDPPRFRGATLHQALHGGEEYELLFTVRPGIHVPESFEDLPLTRIGTIIKGPAGEVRHNGSVLSPMGFDHFRK